MAAPKCPPDISITCLLTLAYSCLLLHVVALQKRRLRRQVSWQLISYSPVAVPGQSLSCTSCPGPAVPWQPACAGAGVSSYPECTRVDTRDTGHDAPVMYALKGRGQDRFWVGPSDDRIMKELQLHVDNVYDVMQSKVFRSQTLIISGLIKVLACCAHLCRAEWASTNLTHLH